MADDKAEEILYQQVPETENVSQGDILFNYPIMLPDESSLDTVTKDGVEGHVRFSVFNADIIILSQACDLVLDHEKERFPVDPVICAAIHGIGKYSWQLVADTNSGNRPAYYLLNKADSFLEESHIINFGQVFTIPYGVLSEFASTSGERIRPTSPILEKISQHFGNYFSRIGTEYERTKSCLKEEHRPLRQQFEQEMKELKQEQHNEQQRLKQQKTS